MFEQIALMTVLTVSDSLDGGEVLPGLSIPLSAIFRESA